MLIFKCEDNIIMNHDSFHMHHYKRLNQCNSFDPADGDSQYNFLSGK